MEETVYRNEETRKESSSWLMRFQKNYKEYKGSGLSVKRWYEIEDKYDLKKVRILKKARDEVQKAAEAYERQKQKVLIAEEDYKRVLCGKDEFELQKAENIFKVSKSRLDGYGKKLEEKREVLRKMYL